MNYQIKVCPTLELLTEIESCLATGLLTKKEIRILSQILTANYSTISETLTQALAEERLKQQELLSSLTPEEREQVDEFLKRHGFKKATNHEKEAS